MPEPYEAEERAEILHVARLAARAALRGEHVPAELSERVPARLREPRGCFVTLRGASGCLRGCIGTFELSRPLVEALVDMAGATTRDARFSLDPVTIDELDDIAISVEVLTPLEPLDDPLDLRIGIDGIFIVGQWEGSAARGCFLPDVATTQGWDVEEFLSRCCEDKCGLPADAWRQHEGLKLFRFQAERIGEDDEP